MIVLPLYIPKELILLTKLRIFREKSLEISLTRDSGERYYSRLSLDKKGNEALYY